MSLPRVAVDASWAQLGPSGVQRYLAGLLPRLAELTPVLALVDPRRPEPSLGVPTVPVPSPVGGSRLAWLELGVGRWLRRFDGLFHGTAYAIPLQSRGPSVTTMHDIAWRTHPVDFGWAKRRVWTVYGDHSARRSAAIITGSQHSRAEILEHLAVEPEAVHVVPIGTSLRSGEPPDAGALAELAARWAVRPPYVVALGGAPRRNLPVAEAAWRSAVAQGSRVGLVVVGSEPPAAADGVVHVGAVDDATWRTLLGAAEAFVYPTSHEGYGLPAMEAISCGTPVVCARVGALPEVLGSAAAWSPSLRADDLGRTLHVLLTDPGGHARQRAAARAQAADAPSWDDAALATRAVYERAWAAR